MFDPTQTQPLSWRMHQGKAMPWEDVPVDPPNRQAPTFDDSPPERLSERGYRLRARLGSGRLGAVYEAQDELSRISGSQHFVAIQLVDSRIASRPGFDAEFERGAAELKSVSHPNVVRLLEYGRDHGRCYLVNELLESASLRFVLNDVGTLPATEATAVMRAVGDALEYLHAKGMVHGNLRPENVLVTFGYEVKLLDLVPRGWLANPDDALGIPARAADKREDVFGLACLAYEMLAGRHPFNGNTAQEAYRAGLEPARIEGLGEREWRALAHALAVHRDDRTPNVAQFLQEFGVARAEQLKAVVASTSAPPPSIESREAPRATYEAPDPPPALARPVLGERPGRERYERSGRYGGAFVLLALIAAGAAAWYYRDPLQAFATDLMAEVEAQMARDSTPAERTQSAATTGAPLERAPGITDTAPATVLAPGASIPAAGEPPAIAPDDPAPVSAAGPADLGPSEQELASTAAPATAVPVPEPAAADGAVPEPAAPGPAYFAFQQDSMTVREGDVAARIVIRRSGSLAGAASVSWWTEEGSARANLDYADLGARVERFAPGEASRTVFVPLTNDSVREPAKSFRVLLRDAEGATAGAALSVTLVDDD